MRARSLLLVLVLCYLVEVALGFDLGDIDIPDVKTPGLCIYYDGHKCRYKSANGIKTSSDGRCPSELKGIVPTCKGKPDPFGPQHIPKVAPAPAPALAPKTTTTTSHTTTTKPSPPKTASAPVQVEIRNDGPASTFEARDPEEQQENSSDKVESPPPIPPPPNVKDSADTKKSGIDSQTVLILGVSVGTVVGAILAIVVGAIIIVFRIKRRQERRLESRIARSASRTQVNQLSNPDLAGMMVQFNQLQQDGKEMLDAAVPLEIAPTPRTPDF